MKRDVFVVFCLICLGIPCSGIGQKNLRDRLQQAVDILRVDSQMKHAVLALSVVKSETGEKIFELNPQTGMAPASCQKTITSAATFELLGAGYRYSTVLGYAGEIVNGTLHGNLYVIGSGDPSLGSWRFDSTKEEIVLQEWITAIKAKGIIKIEGDLIGLDGSWEKETLPGGWIWDDIGNYYGAGTSALNWRENQYDLFLSSGPVVGSKANIANTKPVPYRVMLESELTAGPKGSGDNAYVYLPPYAQKGFVRGTIPVDEKAFKISGAFPDPSLQLLSVLAGKLATDHLSPKNFYASADPAPANMNVLDKHLSPSLDSLNYWFMKKSINLYGEAFVKTIAAEKTNLGSTDKGVKLVKDFWKEQGIESSALHIIDGSGLSPQNRVTTDALVTVLQYAKSRPWFAYYYDALPVYNQMKLKSGTIGGSKSFAGYHTSKDGTAYTVAVIVNNFDGSAGEIVKKLFVVLDNLK